MSSRPFSENKCDRSGLDKFSLESWSLQTSVSSSWRQAEGKRGSARRNEGDFILLFLFSPDHIGKLGWIKMGKNNGLEALKEARTEKVYPG